MERITQHQLEMAVGLHAAARLVILRSKLQENDMIRGQVASDVGKAGPVEECACCGMLVAEGVLH